MTFDTRPHRTQAWAESPDARTAVPAVRPVEAPAGAALDQVRAALAAARDDFDRVAVRDHALKLQRACEIVGSWEWACDAAALVGEAEWVIAQHNPPKPAQERNPEGRNGRGLSHAGDIPLAAEPRPPALPLDRKTLSKIRAAYGDLSYDEFQAAVDESREKREPLSRAEMTRRATAKRREAQQQQRRDASSVEALPEGKFSLILADPPWQYENAPVGDPRRSAEAHYPTMSLDEICGLQVGDIAAEDSALFLWATNPMLPEALKVMDAWGFRYRTNMAWVKDRQGTGYWFRGRHELLLLGVRGRFPTPLKTQVPDSVLQAPRGKHSQKPAEVAEMLERIFPHAAKLELFCRAPRDGWAVWGNESAAA